MAQETNLRRVGRVVEVAEVFPTVSDQSEKSTSVKKVVTLPWHQQEASSYLAAKKIGAHSFNSQDEVKDNRFILHLDYLTHISIVVRHSKARTLRIGIKEAAIKKNMSENTPCVYVIASLTSLHWPHPKSGKPNYRVTLQNLLN